MSETTTVTPAHPHIFKAQPLTEDNPVPDLVLNVSTTFPRDSSLLESAARHDRAATELLDLLWASLPGGTRTRLLAQMLQREASLFIVREPWVRTTLTVEPDTEMSFPNLEACDDRELSEVGVAGTDLSVFAANALRARQHRLAGRTEAASKLEAANEIIYNRLPKWALW